MTPEYLASEQERIDAQVASIARDAKLERDDFKPIFDGVADVRGYLRSRLKIVWVLKELNDYVDGGCHPCGGGWSLPKDYFSQGIDWHKTPRWKIMAHVLRCFHQGTNWLNRERLVDHPEVIDEVTRTPIITVSKMPGTIAHERKHIFNLFRTFWQDVVMEQLELYQPDVIIFGNTFHCFEGLFPQAVKDEALGGSQFFYWRNGDQCLLDAYDPTRKGMPYVDELAHALRIAEDERMTRTR